MPTIVLTGATSGLGQLAAVELARRGNRLILPARSAERAARTEDLIRQAVPGAQISVLLADLSSVAEVRRLAQTIVNEHPRIDVLINNAGLHAFAPRATVDGYPEMVAVNYFAPWVLTNALLPALHAAPSARVVTVASEASRRHGTLRLPHDLTVIEEFTSRQSSLHYGRSKLLDIMFSLELARRLEGTTVTATCLDPGFNVTGLGREVRGAAVIERILKALPIGDPSRGAGLIVDLATSDRFRASNGEYWTVRGPRRIMPTAAAQDVAAQRQLWRATESLLHG